MGWNDGYRVLEQQVISLYDNKLLTKDVLNCIIEPFRETDCDSGGSQNLFSADGLEADEIMFKVWDPEKYLIFLKEIEENPDKDRKSVKCNSDFFIEKFWKQIWRQEWHIW